MKSSNHNPGKIDFSSDAPESKLLNFKNMLTLFFVTLRQLMGHIPEADDQLSTKASSHIYPICFRGENYVC